MRTWRTEVGPFKHETLPRPLTARGMRLDVSTEKRGKRLFRSLQLPLRRGARGAGGPGGLVEGRDLVDGLKVQ